MTERRECELPKCKFCGSDCIEIEEISDFDDDASSFKVACSSGVGACPAHPETGFFYTKDEARMAWRLLQGTIKLDHDSLNSKEANNLTNEEG